MFKPDIFHYVLLTCCSTSTVVLSYEEAITFLPQHSSSLCTTLPECMYITFVQRYSFPKGNTFPNVSSNMHIYSSTYQQGSVLLWKVSVLHTVRLFILVFALEHNLKRCVICTTPSSAAGKDKQISEGFTTNRKEVLRGKRALSVPLVLEIVGCTEQVAIQILFSWNMSSNYSVPLYFAAVNPAFWYQGQHEGTVQLTWVVGAHKNK